MARCVIVIEDKDDKASVECVFDPPLKKQPEDLDDLSHIPTCQLLGILVMQHLQEKMDIEDVVIQHGESEAKH